jgi:hypothetical protein
MDPFPYALLKSWISGFKMNAAAPTESSPAMLVAMKSEKNGT